VSTLLASADLRMSQAPCAQQWVLLWSTAEHFVGWWSAGWALRGWGRVDAVWVGQGRVGVVRVGCGRLGVQTQTRAHALCEGCCGEGEGVALAKQALVHLICMSSIAMYLLNRHRVRWLGGTTGQQSSALVAVVLFVGPAPPGLLMARLPLTVRIDCSVTGLFVTLLTSQVAENSQIAVASVTCTGPYLLSALQRRHTPQGQVYHADMLQGLCFAAPGPQLVCVLLHWCACTYLFLCFLLSAAYL
jgi:hypothetical protein